MGIKERKWGGEIVPASEDLNDCCGTSFRGIGRSLLRCEREVGAETGWVQAKDDGYCDAELTLPALIVQGRPS